MLLNLSLSTRSEFVLTSDEAYDYRQCFIGQVEIAHRHRSYFGVEMVGAGRCEMILCFVRGENILRPSR